MQRLLATENEEVLEAVDRILEEDTAVAYNVRGEPLTHQEYNERIKEAEQDIQEGKTVDASELKRKIDNWKK